VSGADGRERDDDRHTDERTSDAPEQPPKEYRKQHHEGGNRNRSSCHTWFNVAADDELKKVEADENDQRRL